MSLFLFLSFTLSLLLFPFLFSISSGLPLFLCPFCSTSTTQIAWAFQFSFWHQIYKAELIWERTAPNLDMLLYVVVRSFCSEGEVYMLQFLKEGDVKG